MCGDLEGPLVLGDDLRDQCEAEAGALTWTARREERPVDVEVYREPTEGALTWTARRGERLLHAGE